MPAMPASVSRRHCVSNSAPMAVLETMTPRQFTGFRDRLDAASGFQSSQFRELEAVLGRRDASVLDAYPEASPERARSSLASVAPSTSAAATATIARCREVSGSGGMERGSPRPAPARSASVSNVDGVSPNSAGAALCW